MVNNNLILLEKTPKTGGGDEDDVWDSAVFLCVQDLHNKKIKFYLENIVSWQETTKGTDFVVESLGLLKTQENFEKVSKVLEKFIYVVSP